MPCVPCTLCFLPTVALAVIRKCQELGIDRRTELRGMSDEKVQQFIAENMYDPLRNPALQSEHLHL